MQEDHEEKENKRRGLRVFLILGLTALATAAIGYGGLALWSVTTQNNGNSFATGSVHHSNSALLNGAGAAILCTDQAGPCGAVFQISGAGAGSSVNGSVTITNTGTRASTFTLGPGTGANAIVATPLTSNLCTNLNLRIVDGTGLVVYNASLGAFTTTANLRQSGGSNVWATGDSNTFTFTVSLPGSDSDPSDMSASCAAGILWTQTG